MTHVTLQLWHNSAGQPMCEGVTLPYSIIELFGECDITAGSVRMWKIPNSEVRVVLFIDNTVTRVI